MSVFEQLEQWQFKEHGIGCPWAWGVKVIKPNRAHHQDWHFHPSSDLPSNINSPSKPSTLSHRRNNSSISALLHFSHPILQLLLLPRYSIPMISMILIIYASLPGLELFSTLLLTRHLTLCSASSSRTSHHCQQYTQDKHSPSPASEGKTNPCLSLHWRATNMSQRYGIMWWTHSHHTSISNAFISNNSFTEIHGNSMWYKMILPRHPWHVH